MWSVTILASSMALKARLEGFDNKTLNRGDRQVLDLSFQELLSELSNAETITKLFVTSG